MSPDSPSDDGDRRLSLTRRTVAKLSGAAAAGTAVLVGHLGGAFEVDIDREEAGTQESGETPLSQATIALPRPGSVDGDSQVATAIGHRRSRRDFADEPIALAQLGQLLWAAQGITRRRVGRTGFRAAPSAGATYPLELFVVSTSAGVAELTPGVFHYRPADHELERVRDGTFGPQLRDIAIDQEFVEAAALSIVVTGVDERTTQRYGDRGRRRYVPMEAGHAGQNIYLQAEALGLSTVAVGAFRDAALRTLLQVDEDHRPLYIYPVGRRP